MNINEYEIKPNANLNRADLSGANLNRADLSDADLKETILEGLKL